MYLHDKRSEIRLLESSEKWLYVDRIAQPDCAECAKSEMGAECMAKEAELLAPLKSLQPISSLERIEALLAVGGIGRNHNFPYSPETSRVLVGHLNGYRSSGVQAAAALALGYGAHGETVAQELAAYSAGLPDRLDAVKLDLQATRKVLAKHHKKFPPLWKRKTNTKPKRIPNAKQLAAYKEALAKRDHQNADLRYLRMTLAGCVNAMGWVQDDRCTAPLLLCCTYGDEGLDFGKRYASLLRHGTRSCVARVIEDFGVWETEWNDLVKEMEKLSKSKKGPKPKGWKGNQNEWKKQYPQWKAARLGELSERKNELKESLFGLWSELEQYASRQDLSLPAQDWISWRGWFATFQETLPADFGAKSE